MNKRSSNRRIPNAYAENKDRDRDDDLILFRDMQKRDKERNVSLLQPIPTDDLESNSGNFPLFRIASAKKFGFDFFHDSEKNDYDWLKTPPATPLFASLEMDAGAPELVVQRDLPIMANLSRFSGTLHDVLKINPRSKSPDPMAKALTRSFAQHMKHNASSAAWTDTTSIDVGGSLPCNASTNVRSNVLAVTPEHKNSLEDSLKTTDKDLTTIVTPPEVTGAGFSDETTPSNLITTRSTSTTRGRPITPSIVTSSRQPLDRPSTNRSTSTARGRPTTPSMVSSSRQSLDHTSSVASSPNRSSSTTRGRATAPSINTRPKEVIDRSSNVVASSTNRSSSTTRGRPNNNIPSRAGSPPKYVVISIDETPPNLITNRPPSTSRTRPITPSTKKIQKQDPIQSRRQSCSPGTSRGKKPDSNNQNREADHTLVTKKKMQSANGSLAFESSMVEKVMNARKSVSEDADRKPKTGTTIHDHSGFGRFISKGSIDLAPRNKIMEVKRDHVKVSQTNSPKTANTVSNLTNHVKTANTMSSLEATQQREGNKTKISGRGRRNEASRKLKKCNI